MTNFPVYKRAQLYCDNHREMNCGVCAESYLVEGIRIADRRIAELQQRLAEAESKLPKWHKACNPPSHSDWVFVVYVFDGCVLKTAARYVNAAEPYWISASRDVIQVVDWMNCPLWEGSFNG